MDDSAPDFTSNCNTSKNYNINGRIMLTSVLVCFTFCLVFLIFVLYYRSHAPGPENPTGHRFSRSLKSKGLSPFVIKSLPTFLYSSKTHDPALECTVCLAEFQENQSGRVLPGCNHVFHVQCIDTWLASHSDCPLCRTTVRGNDPGTRPGNMHVATGSSSAGPLCRNTVQSMDGYDPVTRPEKMPAITGSNSVGGSCSVPEVAIDIPMEEVDIGSGSGGNELKS